MRNLTVASAALALAISGAATAAPVINVSGGTGPSAITSINNFQTQLAGAGFTQITNGASLFLTGTAKITYEYMGSESGFKNTFTAGSSTYTENSTAFDNKWTTPILIGTQFYGGATSLAGLIKFSSNLGLPANVGTYGFAAFLKPGQLNGYTTIYFGYDDEKFRPDDNHDDFVVRATISAVPVPEPGTWAMLVAGFAIVGSLLRRRQSNGIAVLA